jgi:hypothetical protein
MATSAELLSAVEAAIQARLNGDAYEEYSEAGQRFRGASLDELFRIRARLLGEMGASFQLVELFDV